MRLLAISYNLKEPFACFIREDKPLKFIRETGFYSPPNPYRTFPENAIKEIISCEDIDFVVFLGKPLLYLRNLIHLHSYLFPRGYSRFMKDILDYFEIIAQPLKLIKKIKENNQLNAAKIDLELIYYIRPDDALAYAANDKKDALIITCLADTFEGNSFCCFEERDNKIYLNKELSLLNSFTNLLRIYNEFKHQANLAGLIKIFKNGYFRFIKRYFIIENNSFTIKHRYLSTQGNFTKINEEVLLNIFSKLISPLKAKHEKIIFISDIELPQGVIQVHNDITFSHISQEEKIISASKYLFHKISQLKGGQN